MRTLPDELVQSLLNELEDAGEHHARARARLRDLEERRKIVKSQMMKLGETLGGLKAAAKQEVFAYTHPTYIDLVKELVEAITTEGILDYRRKNAEMAWESWRSINANNRNVTR